MVAPPASGVLSILKVTRVRYCNKRAAQNCWNDVGSGRESCRDLGKRSDLSFERLAGLESMLVDTETQDSRVESLARKAQPAGCSLRSRDDALALRERRLDHLPLVLGERRYQGNDGP